MTTIRQIIIDAFRESGLIEVGTTPEADEYAEAFNRLAVIIKSLVENELGYGLTPVNYGTYGTTTDEASMLDASSIIDATCIPINSQLILNINSAKTLNLAPNPKDGARFGIIDNAGTLATYPLTLNGNGRHIETGSTLTVGTANVAREWFYRGDLGSWTRLTDLDSNAQSPFPLEFDDLLTLMLAMRLNPRYGAQTASEMGGELTKAKAQFKARYKSIQPMPSDPALVRLSTYRYLHPDLTLADYNHGLLYGF